MENRTMKKTLIAITLIASMTFAYGAGKLKNPNGLYPNKKPLISKTPTAVSVMSGDVKRLKVKNYPNSWLASHIHNGCHTKKVKAVSSINRPQRLRKRGR